MHPYNYSVDKTLKHRLLDIGVPIGLFLLLFAFYNFGKISPSEMVKTTGLHSIALLGITLLVGPLSRIFPSLEPLKAHRKFWGITAATVGLIHVSLVVIFFWKFNLLRFLDTGNPKFLGILSGLLALIILGLVTLTSNQKALTKLDPKVWKIIQTTSYLALLLAIAHFYIMETKDGVLVIKRLLGRITLGFSVFVILARIVVLFLPKKK